MAKRYNRRLAQRKNRIKKRIFQLSSSLLIIFTIGLFIYFSFQSFRKTNTPIVPESTTVTHQENQNIIIETESTSDSDSEKETVTNEPTSEPTSETILEEVTNSYSNESSDTLNNEIIQKEEIQKKQSIICLTFDDGPSNLTSGYLDVLAKKGVKATFFIVDYEIGSDMEKIIQREYNDGHTIGLHGTSHDYSIIYSSLDSLVKNFTTLQEKVYTSTGFYSNIIRFPGGSSNTVSKKYCSSIMSEAAKYLTNSNFIYFDWNVDSKDAGGAYTSYEIYQNVVKTLVPGRTNVVLMHDSSTKKNTLDALEQIIDYGLENGYTFQNLTETTQKIKHGIKN